MTKPIPDKAEVAVEYPDKLYIGTFEQTARFDAHLDKNGISLSLHRQGDADTRKSVRMHFHYAVRGDFARSCENRDVTALEDVSHREALRDAAKLSTVHSMRARIRTRTISPT